MASNDKARIKEQLAPIFGRITPAAKGNSLYFSEEGTSFYIRYSKRHDSDRTPTGFYGLRKIDLEFLRSNNKGAVIFITDCHDDLIFVPISRMLEYLEPVQAAQDGSYKCQVVFGRVPELTLAGTGRVGLGAYLGLPLIAPMPTVLPVVDRQHAVIQKKLKEIGLQSGFDVWVPRADRSTMVSGAPVGQGCMERLDVSFVHATHWVVEIIDVVWVGKAKRSIEALFEVEHSTSIYSGLLRLNDVIIDLAVPRLGIVTDPLRHETYVRHVARRTFEKSGLSNTCCHYTYEDIEQWHQKATQ